MNNLIEHHYVRLIKKNAKTCKYGAVNEKNQVSNICNEYVCINVCQNKDDTNDIKITKMINV